jgi:hypothetical protein
MSWFSGFFSKVKTWFSNFLASPGGQALIDASAQALKQAGQAGTSILIALATAEAQSLLTSQLGNDAKKQAVANAVVGQASKLGVQLGDSVVNWIVETGVNAAKSRAAGTTATLGS